MRAIMDTFDGHKKEFRSDGRDIKLDLTEPSLANITIDGKVDEGQITIKRYMMSVLPEAPFLTKHQVPI